MDRSRPFPGSTGGHDPGSIPEAAALATWAILGLSGIDRSHVVRRTGQGFDVVNVVDGRSWAVDVPDGVLWWVDPEIRVMGDLPPIAGVITHSMLRALWQELPEWLHQVAMQPETIRLSEMRRFGDDVGLHPRLLTELERGMTVLLRCLS